MLYEEPSQLIFDAGLLSVETDVPYIRLWHVFAVGSQLMLVDVFWHND